MDMQAPTDEEKIEISENITPQKLSDALRDRANFLNKHSASYLEVPTSEHKGDVIASLLEIADVIDSWSGEILSKEDLFFLNQKRRIGEKVDDNGNPIKLYKELPQLKNEDRYKNAKNLKKEVKILKEKRES